MLACVAEQGGGLLTFLLLNMLQFFMGLSGHIQLASLYDGLKLLLALCKNSEHRTTQALLISTGIDSSSTQNQNCNSEDLNTNQENNNSNSTNDILLLVLLRDVVDMVESGTPVV